MNSIQRLNFCRTIFFVIATCSVVFSSAAKADENIPARFQLAQQKPTVAVAPLIDDAHLWDVDVVGKRAGWAVGDHGAVWKTTDGENWVHVPVPTKGTLRAVRFLTNQIGWIVGHETQEFSRVGQGIVLRTEDGGKTWERFGYTLPPLNHVQFFGPDEGVVAGEASVDFPTGVAITEDAGETWTAAAGLRSEGWNAGHFQQIRDGVVVGAQGRVSLIAGNQVAEPRTEPTGLRALHDISLENGLTGWAVGDGALAMSTLNGGVSWTPPVQDFPVELRSMVDFTTVVSRKKKVWIAGSPGSVIWYSPDAGQTWQRQLTGQTQPIHSLDFSNDNSGCAVGALGMILLTTDGGASWRAARGGSRRAALLTAHATKEQIPFGAIAKFAGDQGFRTVSLVMSHQGSSTQIAQSLSRSSRIHEAVVAAGGSRAIADWRLPYTRPEVENDMRAITAEWQRFTDNRLVETVMSNLVSKIRTWKPSVVVIDEPRPNNAMDRIINDAVQRAIREAADPTRHTKQLELCGLTAWHVQKIFVRTADSTRGTIVVQPFDTLFGLHCTVESQAQKGRSLLFTGLERLQKQESFNAVRDPSKAKFVLANARDFWRELSISPGSEARRPSLPWTEEEYERQEAIARRQRNMRAIAAKVMDEPGQGAQLIAELRRGIIKGMPKAQAAAQLVGLANDFRRRSRWDQAEAVMLELIQNYPDEPVTREAMVWLLHLWSSDEMAWHRSKSVNLEANQKSTSRTVIQQRMQQLVSAASRKQLDPLKVARQLTFDPIAQLETTGTLPSQSDQDWTQATGRYWHGQGIAMARLMQRESPQLLSTQMVEWPLASLLRRRQHYRVSENIYRRRFSTSKLDPIARVAVGELWTSQPTAEQPDYIAVCTWATAPPYLDGVLGDGVWQNARELVLRDDEPVDAASANAVKRESYPFAMIARDDKFMYLAASIPRVATVRTDGPDYDGRRHDSDLTGFDRVSFYLDVDRDYTTSYAIHIDQRGHAAESAWEDKTWNPKMHIAINGDAKHWRLEAAIPIRELVEVTPRKGETWAVSIQRTVPKTKWQSWIGSPNGKTDPGQFGLLQFR
jgi:photosystem II stability/assembly factor-like uncharacterized protein